MEQALLDHYKNRRGDAIKACNAIKAARVDMEKTPKTYGATWHWKRGAHNVTRQEKKHSSDNYAWIENTNSAGLRFVGYCDEICSGHAIDHKGWFINEFEDETYRGAVWQLPGRKGVARFIAGYQDPNNDGAAFVSLDIVSFAPAVCMSRSGQDIANDEAKRDAARQADSIAMCNAERERGYNEGWQAGARWADLGEQIATERRETLELLSEMKAERKAREATAPTICATLRKVVARSIRDIAKMRKERADLFDNYGHSDGFADHLPRA
jgi:hypothetical protein